jgi:UDP-N-acetylglucosamine 2-epimerase (non-hydrolysing)
VRILGEVARLLDNPDDYAAMARGVSPYGDGRAAGRIVDILKQDLFPQATDAATA